MILKLLGIKCTRATQIVFDLTLVLAVWAHLVTFEVAVPIVFLMRVLPYWAIVTFACYALFTIGFELAKMKDYEDYEIEMQTDIERSKAFLMDRGFN